MRRVFLKLNEKFHVARFYSALLWSELFVALPSFLGWFIFHAIAFNPHYQLFCLRFGIWGLILGMSLPEPLFMMLGGLFGYCIGIVVTCRFYGKERFTVLLGKKEIWLFSALTKRVLSLISG